MSLLEPAAAVAVGICLAARLRGAAGRRPITLRHPPQGCAWEDWPAPDLLALLEDFDPDGADARTFAQLRHAHQEAMVLAAQAIPEPAPVPAPEPAEPGWFDLPEGGEA